MAHQYKLGKTTINDIQTMIDAAQEFAGTVDAAQSGLSSEIEDQRDFLGEKSESFLDSERGQQIELWLSTLEEAVDHLNSIGEALGELVDDLFPAQPEG